MPPLRRLSAESIHEGVQLPGALCDRTGSVLMPAGSTLTAADIIRLRSRLRAGVYVGSDWPDATIAESGTATATASEAPARIRAADPPQRSPSTRHFINISVDSLRIGTRLARSIYDQSGRLLLARGSRVTLRFVQLLSQRRIHIVAVRRPTAATASAPLVEVPIEPRRVAQFKQPDPSVALGSGHPWDRCRLEPESFWSAVEQGAAQLAQTAVAMEGFCAALMQGRTLSSDRLIQVVNGFADMMTVDSDLLPLIVGLRHAPAEYLFEHCVSTSLLSMAIGAQLGLSREQVHVLGLSAMLHDIGMLRVPAEIRMANRPLNPAEMAAVRRHPLHALRILQQVRGLPADVAAIACQVHDRVDQSGYPCISSDVPTHPHAGIVAVADAFSAMMERRPYRAPIPAHIAVRELLVQGSTGRFDRRVLRALLDAVSAFPVGSLVELKKGVIGRVVRANPGAHTRPVIVVVDEHGRPSDWTIDLADERGLAIVRASLQSEADFGNP